MLRDDNEIQTLMPMRFEGRYFWRHTRTRGPWSIYPLRLVNEDQRPFRECKKQLLTILRTWINDNLCPFGKGMCWLMLNNQIRHPINNEQAPLVRFFAQDFRDTPKAFYRYQERQL